MSLAEAIHQLGDLAEEIKREAFSDDKTSLGSGLALRQEELLNRTGGGDEFQVVVFGDLNDFKHINDDYSHDAEDVALRAVGDTIRRIVIDEIGAKAFRRSGDEFVILLKTPSLEEFLSTVTSFERIPFSHNKRELSTAMSFGYAVGNGKASFDELIQRADAACQIAKRPGSQSCVPWTADIDTNPLVRVSGWCEPCEAKISCTLPRQNVSTKPIRCPFCGTSVRDKNILP
jgi:diguanylate cyclase (GGDEF)-like protein